MWDSDVKVDVIFESLSVNIISASHLEDDGEDIIEFEELIQLDSESWLNNTLRTMRPTEDKVIQINLGDEANSKPIFISESLSPFEKED